MALVVAQLLIGLLLIVAGIPLATYVNKNRGDTAGGTLVGTTVMIVGLVFVASSVVLMLAQSQG